MIKVDAVVIGAGIVGLSTLDYMVKRGIQAVCIEKYIPGCGQSAGLTRIYRQRHQNPQYVSLAKEALVHWKQWEKEFKTELIINSGQLSFGSDLESQYVLNKNNGIHCDLLTKLEWQKLVKTHAAIEGNALFEYSAGAIKADVIIGLLAKKHHPKLIRDSAVRIETIGNKAKVKAINDTYECSQLIIAAGVDTPELAKQVGLEINTEKRLHTRLTFQSKVPRSKMPSISDRSGQYGEHVYGSPINDYQYAVGLSDKSDNLTVDSQETWDWNVQRIRDYVASAMPVLYPEETAIRKCTATYIKGPEDKFHIYEKNNIKAIAGHNLFKFGPALGKSLGG